MKKTSPKKKTKRKETIQQRTKRLKKDKLRKKKKKVKETNYEKNKRLKVNRDQYALIKKKNKHVDLLLEAFNYKSNIDYSQHPTLLIGQMSIICEYCNAVKFEQERPGMCCSSGKVFLNQIEPPPEPLLQYISGKYSI